MLTMDQAVNAQEFHEDDCILSRGPRGGERLSQIRWRRNGKTKLWKTRPHEFRIPVKHALKDTGYITHQNMEYYHAAEDCPLNKKEEQVSSEPHPLPEKQLVCKNCGYMTSDHRGTEPEGSCPDGSGTMFETVRRRPEFRGPMSQEEKDFIIALNELLDAEVALYSSLPDDSEDEASDYTAECTEKRDALYKKVEILFKGRNNG